MSRKPESGEGQGAVAAACTLLAELLSREVDEELLAVLRLPGVSGVIAGADPAAGALLEDKWDRQQFEDHAVEFCRLFIRPCVCLPLAGRWAKGYEDEHFSIRRWFMAEQPLTGLAPHLAELSDTHVAKILAVRAGLDGLPEDLVTTFEDEMIRPWCPAFGETLSSSAELPLYRAVGGLVQTLGD